jgi:7-cyano-7-deazaguanine synthase in queuosine biosynthesis
LITYSQWSIISEIHDSREIERLVEKEDKEIYGDNRNEFVRRKNME